MTQKKKNNIILGSLCAVVLLMAVGYAAFSSILNIKGTSTIGSNWNILITNVESKNIVGSASNEEEPSWENLTATFKTNLVSPGDSIEYDITIENRGNLNAKLDKITLTDSNNPAIKFTSSGVEEGSELNAGDSQVLTVKVEYDNNVTSQPDNTEGTFTVTLDYSQKEGSSEGPSPITPSDLISKVVTTGDGLYEDTTETGRYIYKGANPDNYITFNDETYRIIAVESNGTLKIVRNESIGNITFDPGYSTSISGVTNANSIEGTRFTSTSTDYCYHNLGVQSDYNGCKIWGSKSTMLNSSGTNITKMPREAGSSTTYDLPEKEAYLNTYLNGTWYQGLSTEAKSLVNTYIWNVGILKYQSGQTLETDLQQESAYKWRGKVGLINPTDYVKANTNTSLCGNVYANTSEAGKYATCKITTWLFNNDYQWSMVPYSYSGPLNSWFVSLSGNVAINTVINAYGVRPVLYLTPNITLSGEGTNTNPYTITK